MANASPYVSASRLLQAIASVFKAHPESLADALDVFDARTADVDSSNWREGQKTIPGNRAIPVSTEQEMSGAGTKMVAEFSDVTPQTDITELYRQFSQLLSRAKSESIKAAVAETAEARQAHVIKAAKLLETGRALIKTFADMEETDDENDDEDAADKAEKALRRLAKAQATLDRIAGTVTAKAGGDDGALPTMTAGQLMETVAGRGGNSLQMPPDFSASYLAKAQTESLSDKIEAAYQRGDLTEGQNLEAATLLSHFNVAKAGRVPMEAFLAKASSASSPVQQLFGVEGVHSYKMLG